MSVLDVESLLSPVSSEAPCGENLEYDADYAAMEQAAAGKPEQQFGATTIPGEEPDWKEVCGKARELFSRTKDLRVGMYLVRGATWIDGLIGLADGMQVLAGLVEQYWDGVHPQLDPDDDNDPTLRLNTIASLTDSTTMLRAVQTATMVSPRGMGKVCYRDVLVAAGELPQPAGAEKVEASTIDGAFAACEPGELKATAQAVKQALEQTRGMESVLVDKVGVSSVPQLDAFTDMLAGMNKLLEQKLAARGILDEEQPAGAADSTEDTADNGHAEAGATNGRRVAMAANATGDISSREDVIRALDRICDYYKRYEPSSPVPLFLNRAKRLASKSFLEILRDLTPDAVNQALAIGGITDGAAASAGVDENDV